MRGTRGNRNHSWSIQHKQRPTLRGLWKEFLEEVRAEANSKQEKCSVCLPKVDCANDLRTEVPDGGKAADLIPAAFHNVPPTPPAWEVVTGGRDHDLRARLVTLAKPWEGDEVLQAPVVARQPRQPPLRTLRLSLNFTQVPRNNLTLGASILQGFSTIRPTLHGQQQAPDGRWRWGAGGEAELRETSTRAQEHFAVQPGSKAMLRPGEKPTHTSCFKTPHGRDGWRKILCKRCTCDCTSRGTWPTYTDSTHGSLVGAQTLEQA